MDSQISRGGGPSNIRGWAGPPSFENRNVIMYAIVRDSGQQFKVEEGQELNVDYRQAAKGDEISLGEVLAVGGDDGLKLGRPVVDGAKVTAEVLGVAQGPKIYVQKMRRRTHNSRTRTGHRQMYTRVRIRKIEV